MFQSFKNYYSRLAQLINGQNKTITSAAMVIIALSLASRFLGMYRDRILASQFGAGDVLDVYYAAFRIPDFIYTILVLGTLSAGFIPVFVSLIKEDGQEHREAWDLANGIANMLFIILAVLSVFVIITAPIFVPLITPGFNAEKMSMAVTMTRIMFISPIILSLSAVVTGIMESFKNFFVDFLSPIVYNIGIIIGALFFTRWWGIYGLAWGVILGAVFHLTVQLPKLFSLGYRYKYILDFKDKVIRRIIKMTIPRILSLAVNQINLFVITIAASMLASGTLSIFNLVNNLQSFPVGIFGISLAIAAFPTLSALITKNKNEEFIQTLSNTLRQILFFVVPISALFIVLRAQIIRAIFGAGYFDWSSTILAADTLAFFSISLFAQAISPLLCRGFYVFEDSRTPFYIGAVSALINIIFCFTLGKTMGVSGLALAFSISSLINAALLFIFLRKKLGRIDGSQIALSSVKIFSASFIAALVAQAMKYVVEPFFGTSTFLGILAQGVIAGGIGLIIYLTVCIFLRSPEAVVFIEAAKKKLLGKNVPDEGIEETMGM